MRSLLAIAMLHVNKNLVSANTIVTLLQRHIGRCISQKRYNIDTWLLQTVNYVACWIVPSPLNLSENKKCGRRVRLTRYPPPASDDTGTTLGEDCSDW